MTKLVYQTNSDGYFVGSVEADPSPLESGIWLIPGGAVEIPPPNAQENQVARWDGSQWALETVQAQEPEPVETRLFSLTARQLRLGLVLNGFSLDQVTATIDATENEQDRAVATIEWEYASQFERDHHLIAQVGAALGLTEAQIDTMWEQALVL